MENNAWDNIWEVIKQEMKREDKVNNNFQFSHYTSLEVLFNILEGDSIWAANVRFSNDAMEERILKSENPHMRDDYIICFCSEGDALSQWRGYCHAGGASIKFKLNGPKEYSILHADYETTGKYEIYENVPIPVLYTNTETDADIRKNEIQQTIQKKATGITLEDVIPYLKNEMFYEEKESRLVFANIKGNLSECIRFRKLENGVKVPYMIVKSGDIGKMNRRKTMDISRYTDGDILELLDDQGEIWLEEGLNLEKKYFELLERIQKLKAQNSKKGNVDIYCKGHLPIKEIIVAPTYDRERIAEQVERFCKSKYWLSNVKVKQSKIPYIGSNN